MNFFKLITKTATAFVLAALMSSLYSANAQNTVTTVPPLNGGNGSDGCTFQVTAVASSVLITEIGGSYNVGPQTPEIWYRPGGVSATPGTPPNITTGNGWVNVVATGTVSITGGGTGVVTPIPAPLSILIPAGQTYGFYVGGGGAIYTTHTAANQTVFTDGILSIESGPNTGYGGSVPNPTFSPRQFNGSVTYAPIAGPNSIGIVGLDSPQASCPGPQNAVITVANFGSNQVNTFDVDWELDGVAQTQINVSTLLDTLNGAGSSSTQIVLGSINLVNGQTYNIKAWVSNPNGVADTVNFDDTVDVNYTSTIPTPTALSASNLGPNSADASWSGGAGGSFLVEYGPLGFLPGSGTAVTTTNNPYTISGLSANTSYDFYVSTICSGGDTSAAAGPVSFTTTCAVYANPFEETFDGPSWVTSFPLAIDQCWSVVSPSFLTWQPEDANTSSSSTGPLGDVDGTGKYVYLETSSGSLNDTADLITPVVDISNLTAPQAEFYYHMFGATIGTLIFEVNDGGTWTTLWSLSGQQQASSSDPWVKVNIPFTVSDDTVNFRFRGVRGGSFTGDISIDEFRIFQPIPNDFSVIAIDSLTSGCGLTSNETLAIKLTNLGTATFNSGFSFPVSADVNGIVTTETATLGGTLAPGDTFAYTFTTPFDLSTFGSYNFKAFAQLPGDTANTNDTAFATITNIPIITNFPYSENFDAGPGGWTSGGASSTWALGTPAGTAINSAASAPNSWMTGLSTNYNNNEASFVLGPCFAFDSLIAPELSVDVWWESEFSWDGMQAQYSLDGGTTWQKVSSFGDPNSTNWYTDNTVNGLQTGFGDGDGWSGAGASGSGGWVTATADLSPIAGQNDVLFRMAFGSDGSVNGFDGVAFDDFQIIETALPFNVELLDVINPVSGCGLSATDTVIFEYANIGLNPITTGTTLNFTYYINGTPTTENLVLASDLLPGDTTTYTFNATVDLSVPATYAFGAVATFGADQNPLDDSLGFDIVSIPVISSFPYYEDFEGGNGGWTSGGTNNSWEFGTPAGTFINTASSGVNAWMTGLATNYNNGEESFVLGPCFDFTNLVLPLIKMDVNWNSEFSWDGAQLQASTNAGATWQVIGGFGDPFNWYNDNSVNGLGFTGVQDGWTGTAANSSNGWLTAENDLSTFAGNSGVLMRVVFGSDGSVNGFDGFAFDNFHILESPNNDIAVDSLIGLQSGCGYTSTTPISMRITNRGVLPQSNIPVFYTVNGVASPIETIANTINPGQTFVYNFTNTADLSTPATYTIFGHAALTTDEDTTNDVSNAKIFQSLFTPEVLSVTNGETCESGPVTLSMTTNGDTDQWFDVPTGGSPIGTGASYTLPNVTQDDTLWAQTIMNATGCNSASASGRIPVFAFHSTTPVINYTSAVAGNLTINFTSSLSANVDSVLWDFGYGTATSTAANPSHTFPASQSYLVTLTAYAGSCIADTTKAIFVPVGGLNDNVYTNLSVYPNPSNGSFRIEADDIQGEVDIQIISMTGETVYNEKAVATRNKLVHDVVIENISGGTYLLKIQNDEILINGRIVLE